MFYLIIRHLVIILFKILFRFEAFGQKNIPLKGGFILASNHISYLDPPALGAACPRVLFFLAKEELFKVPFLGSLITNLNALPIKTKSGDFASLRRAIKELKAGKALTIFPEGRRTEDIKLDEPMRGIGLLAAKARIPIVPAFIEGSNRALPIDSKFIRLKKIKVFFGPAFWPEKVGARLNRADFYQAIADLTMKEIYKLKKEVNG